MITNFVKTNCHHFHQFTYLSMRSYCTNKWLLFTRIDLREQTCILGKGLVEWAYYWGSFWRFYFDYNVVFLNLPLQATEIPSLPPPCCPHIIILISKFFIKGRAFRCNVFPGSSKDIVPFVWECPLLLYLSKICFCHSSCRTSNKVCSNSCSSEIFSELEGVVLDTYGRKNALGSLGLICWMPEPFLPDEHDYLCHCQSERVIGWYSQG